MVRHGRTRRNVTAAGRALIGIFFLMLGQAVFAGEIQTLVWETENGAPVLRVQLSGAATFEAMTLEHGQRLRVSFPDSTLSPALKEPGGQGLVKGVYPYLAESGNAVNIDLLLTEPGQMEVRKTPGGYRVAVAPAGAPRPGTAAEPEKTANETVSVAVPPPVDDRNMIEDIVYARLPGDRIQVTLKMSKPPVEPQSFTITNPARISLDFAGARLGTPSKTPFRQRGRPDQRYRYSGRRPHPRGA